MAHILYIHTLLVMESSTFNGPSIIFIFILNEFNPPYIMPHVVCTMH